MIEPASVLDPNTLSLPSRPKRVQAFRVGETLPGPNNAAWEPRSVPLPVTRRQGHSRFTPQNALRAITALGAGMIILADGGNLVQSGRQLMVDTVHRVRGKNDSLTSDQLLAQAEFNDSKNPQTEVKVNDLDGGMNIRSTRPNTNLDTPEAIASQAKFVITCVAPGTEARTIF